MNGQPTLRRTRKYQMALRHLTDGLDGLYWRFGLERKALGGKFQSRLNTFAIAKSCQDQHPHGQFTFPNMGKGGQAVVWHLQIQHKNIDLMLLQQDEEFVAILGGGNDL